MVTSGHAHRVRVLARLDPSDAVADLLLDWISAHPVSA
jgi:hypothetical protein